MATAVMLTARSVADAYARFVHEPVDDVLLSGGGARNPALVAAHPPCLRGTRRCGRRGAFDEVFFDGEAKEAVAFALLAWLHVHGRAGNVPSAHRRARRARARRADSGGRVGHMSDVAQLLIPSLRADADGRFAAARDAGTRRAGARRRRIRAGRRRPGGACASFTKELQQRSRVPLLIGAELERGAGQQFVGATGLPPLAALAWLGDAEALRRAARLTAREARTMGVNWNLAPVLRSRIGERGPATTT